MQTTFVDNYKRVQRVTGIPVVADPDLLLDVKKGLIAACIYWKENGCNELADQGKLRKCRRVINGGRQGLSHMTKYYKRILPMVKDFNFTKTTAIAGSVGAGVTTAGVMSTSGWVAIIVAVVVLAAVAGFIGYQAYRRRKDVENAITEVKGLSHSLDQWDHDLAVGSALDRSRRAQFLDGNGSNPPIA